VIGKAATQHLYDRLSAFTLFVEEGYHHRPEAQSLPRAISEALAALMWELGFEEIRKQRSIDGLLAIMPQLAYTVLAPFTGPRAAGEFVAGKLVNGPGRK
jgi:hypothetical protein